MKNRIDWANIALLGRDHSSYPHPLPRRKRPRRYKWPFYPFYRGLLDWRATKWNNPIWMLESVIVDMRMMYAESGFVCLNLHAKRNYRRSVILLPFLILIAEAL